MSTSWEYSRQLVFDNSGNRCPGALAFFFEASTTTPLPVYQDAALSVAHTHPVEADASGRMPRVYLPTGTYRIRVTKAWTDPPNNTAPGIVLWDDDDVDGTPVQVVEGETVDETKIFSTGELKEFYGSGVKSGWVRCNNRTIGSSISGASERANADCEDLFIHLWNADDSLEVAGGRGATADADWAANKTIALPDFRNAIRIALGDMGNTAVSLIHAGAFDTGDGVTIGSAGGESEHTLTEAELAEHTHDASSGEAGEHHHELWSGTGSNPGSAGFGNVQGRTISGIPQGTNEAYFEQNTQSNQLVSDEGVHDHTVTVESTGSGDAHNNMPPFRIAGTVYIRL